MRLCHATSKGLDLPVGRSHRSVKADRWGCHPLPMRTHCPSLAGGFNNGDPQHLDMAGCWRFSGAPMSQVPGVYPARGTPSVLTQKGDWCGSAMRPSPSERKLKARTHRQRDAQSAVQMVTGDTSDGFTPTSSSTTLGAVTAHWTDAPRMRCTSTRLTANWQPETQGRFHLRHCPSFGVHF
jgi:hypothetical protein